MWQCISITESWSIGIYFMDFFSHRTFSDVVKPTSPIVLIYRGSTTKWPIMCRMMGLRLVVRIWQIWNPQIMACTSIVCWLTPILRRCALCYTFFYLSPPADSRGQGYSDAQFRPSVCTGWRKKRGHPISLQLFWKFHNRIAWKLVNFTILYVEHSH